MEEVESGAIEGGVEEVDSGAMEGAMEGALDKDGVNTVGAGDVNEEGAIRQGKEQAEATDAGQDGGEQKTEDGQADEGAVQVEPHGNLLARAKTPSAKVRDADDSPAKLSEKKRKRREKEQEDNERRIKKKAAAAAKLAVAAVGREDGGWAKFGRLRSGKVGEKGHHLKKLREQATNDHGVCNI